MFCYVGKYFVQMFKMSIFFFLVENNDKINFIKINIGI